MSRMTFVFPSSPTNNADMQLNCFLSTLISFVLFTLNSGKVTRRNQVFLELMSQSLNILALNGSLKSKQTFSWQDSTFITQVLRPLPSDREKNHGNGGVIVNKRFYNHVPFYENNSSYVRLIFLSFIFLKCSSYFKQSITKAVCLQTHFSSAPAPKKFQFVLYTEIFDDKNKVRAFQFVVAS